MRLEMLNPPYQGRNAEWLSEWLPPGVEPTHLMRLLLNNHPELMERMMQLPGFLHGPDSHLDTRTRELAAIRTLARCGNRYEWGMHIALAGDEIGLTERQRTATVTGSADDRVWDKKDRIVLRTVDELHDTGTLSDATWKALLDQYDPAQALEICTLTGWNTLTSCVANSLQPEPEDFAAPFPETAAAGRS
jgi:alkylhydroperoxidase family enzyme